MISYSGTKFRSITLLDSVETTKTKLTVDLETLFLLDVFSSHLFLIIGLSRLNGSHEAMIPCSRDYT